MSEASSFVLHSGASQVLGAAPDVNDKKLLVTSVSQGVQLYDVLSQECESTWTASPGTVFTAPAVHRPPYLFSAIANSTLVRWKFEDVDIEKGQSKTLKHPIKSLFSLPDVDLIVVFLNGRLALCNSDTMDLFSEAAVGDHGVEAGPLNGNGVGSAEYEIEFVQVEGRDIHILARSSDGAHIVSVYSVRGKKKFTIKHAFSAPLPPPTPGCAVASCTFFQQSQQSQSVISLVWSTGLWEVYKFTLPTTSSSSSSSPVLKKTLSQNLSFLHISPSPKATPSSNTKTPKSKKRTMDSAEAEGAQQSGEGGVASVLLSETLVAVVGKVAPSHKLLKTDSSPHTLTLWNANYGVLQSRCALPVAPNGSSADGETVGHSGRGDKHKIIHIGKVKDGQYVFTVTSRGVIVTPVQLGSTLAQLVGSARATRELIGGQNLHATSPFAGSERSLSDLLHNARANGAHTSGDDNGDEAGDNRSFQHVALRPEDLGADAKGMREQQVMSALLDPKRTPTVAEFTKLFDQYTAEASRAESELSHAFVTAAAGRCASERFFAPLGPLLLTGCVSSLAVPHLVHTLAQANQIWLLDIAMSHMKDIPESDVVVLLKYFLSQVDDKELKAHVESEFAKSLPVDECRAHMVANVMSLPLDPVLIHAELASLSLEDTLAMLKYARSWLERHQRGTFTEADKVLRVPSLSELVQWISQLIDSHFTELALVQDSHKLLADLRLLVSHEDTLCQSFLQLHGMVSHLKRTLEKKVFRPKTPSTGMYSIEVLIL